MDFKPPVMATGKVIPGGILTPEKIKELKETERIKKQNAHDWKIAIFSTIGGGVMGFITSLIFWLVTK